MPHQMALGTDGNTFICRQYRRRRIDQHCGSEPGTSRRQRSLPADSTPTGTANLIYPRTLAMGLFGLQFIMSDGSQWKVVNGNQATVRPADGRDAGATRRRPGVRHGGH